jgi:uncharacterized membrane protein
VNSATPTQRITSFIDDIRPQPGSIVFLPVPVAFFFQYGNQAGSLQPFACTPLVTSVALLLMWVVERVDHLLDPETPSEYLRYTTARLFIIPLGTLLTIAVAFYNVWLAEGIFLCFFVLGWFLRGVYYRHNPGKDYPEGTTRICSITDNMTAVATTFLIVTITGTLQSDSQQPFSKSLKAVLDELPVYGLSLLIVGVYWLSHHRIYMVIRRHNMTLIWLNFAFLLFIEFQLLFNALHASYPKSQLTAILSIAVIFYRNNFAIYFWLLVMVLEAVDLIYRRVRRASYKKGQVQAEADG